MKFDRLKNDFCFYLKKENQLYTYHFVRRTGQVYSIEMQAKGPIKMADLHCSLDGGLEVS